MIVKVLVKQKTSNAEVFDYQVDEGLKVELLSLVEVPFRNKKIIGIVQSVTNKSAFKTKSILRKLTAGAILTTEQIKIAQIIATEFISQTSEALFSFLPNLNIKDLAKLNSPIPSCKQINSKSEFVIGSFWERINYYIGADDHHSQTLIVVPEISMVEKVRLIYKKISDKKIYVWHSKIKSSEKTRILNDLFRGENITIISTRHGIFLPFTKIKNIFIDQPTNFAHFEDQEPYYNAYKTARLISKVYRANLFIGDCIPDLVSFAAIVNKKIKLIELKNNLEIFISGPFYKLTNDLRITDKIDKKSKILVAGFFKDFFGLVCVDCKMNIKCLKCGTGHFNSSTNLCANCASFKPPVCPHCRSVKIIQTGATKQKTREELIRLGVNIDQYQICDFSEISTLSPKFKVAFIPYFDFYSNYPFITFREKIFRFLLDLPNVGVKKCFIFGEDLQNQDFANLVGQMDWKKFLNTELSNRQKSSLPPFKTTIKIEAKKPEYLEKITKKLVNIKHIVNDEKSIYLFVDNAKALKIARALKTKLQGIAKVRIDPVEFA